MFGWGKKRVSPADQVEQVKVAEPEPVVPFPAARVPLRLVEPVQQRSYEEIAQQLGFLPAELIRAQLLEFFEQEGIKLYDYAQVDAWLTKKRAEAKAERWCWRPLRRKDVIKKYVWGYDDNDKPTDGLYDSRVWSCRPYERLVPMHVLEKVVRIEAKFGDRVKFFVSDYDSPNADPFIMVRPKMCNSGPDREYDLIFDVWDEPGFGV